MDTFTQCVNGLNFYGAFLALTTTQSALYFESRSLSHTRNHTALLSLLLHHSGCQCLAKNTLTCGIEEMEDQTNGLTISKQPTPIPKPQLPHQQIYGKFPTVDD